MPRSTHPFTLLPLLWGLAWLSSPLAATPSDAEFLLQVPNARAAALAGADGACQGCLDSLRSNPAGLAGLTSLDLSAAHESAPGDWSHEWAALGGPLGRFTLGAELQLSNLQPFTLYDANGQPMDSASSSSQTLGLSAAAPLGRWVSAGLEGHFFRSQLYTYGSQGLSLDVGLNLHWPGHAWALGLALQNLGSQSAYISAADPLPLRGRVALQTAWLVDAGLTVRPSAELVAYQDTLRPPELRGGLEATLFDRVDLRGGWMHSLDWDQPSLGAGFRWQQLELDYAYLPGGALGDSQLLELSLRDL